MKSDFAAFIPVVNRPDLLERAVSSVESLWRELTVIDNSPNGLEIDLPCDRFRSFVPMTFTQTQNAMFEFGRNAGAEFIVWLHSDVQVPDGVFPELLEEARRLKGQRWGVLYTYYDIVSAVNLEAAFDIGGYDTNIRAYKSDQDFYHRMRLAGWETIDTGIKVEELKAAHLGSQTIRSDPKLLHLNGIIQELDAQYYRAKWGSDADREIYKTPFNR